VAANLDLRVPILIALSRDDNGGRSLVQGDGKSMLFVQKGEM